MIDKADAVYNLRSNSQELPTIVLRDITDETSTDYEPIDRGYTSGNIQFDEIKQHKDQQNQYGQQLQAQTPAQSDSFMRSHPNLAQCIAEIHRRSEELFPLRKPCQCSSKVAHSYPPSHFWSLPPNIPSQTSLGLPPSTMSSSRISPVPSTLSSGIGIGNDTPRTYSPVTNGHQSTSWQGTHHVVGEENYSSNVLPLDGPPIPPPSTLSLSSEVDTINFELGTLNQSWMTFF